MLKCFLGLVLSLLPGLASAADAPSIAQIDQTVKVNVGKDTPGLGVLVMKDGEILHMKGYGLMDFESERPVTPQTLFDLASVSKNMTALAAMLQIEEGLYSEDTPVSTLLPDFAKRDDPRPITVGDLIHHVSGLPDYLSGDETLGYDEETGNDAVVAWLATQPLDRPPGTRFDYSNSGYLTLGSLVMAADEADSLDAVLKARIFDPLGMRHTATLPSGRAKGGVPGYKGSDGNFEESSEGSATEGDGNVLTTLEDLARYEAALANNTLLSAEATKRLFTNGRYDNGKPIADEDGLGYGFGWVVEDGGQSYVSHTGSWMGTSTYYQRNLTTGVTVILLANGEDMDHAELGNELESIVTEEE